MAFRRSARLSALAESIKAVAEPIVRSVPPAKSRKRKAPPEDPTSAEPPSAAEPDRPAPAPAPSTPQKRRVRKAELPPPTTPTPSAVGLITASSPAVPSVTRVADPNTTNATLLSPETSRIVASRPLVDVSPSKAPAVRTTTATLLEDACKHLIKIDERMRPLIEKHHCRVFSPEGLAEAIDPFESLASGIISQQVSGAAAKAIKTRFVALFDPETGNGADPAATTSDSTTAAPHKRFPHPSEVVGKPIETLRTAGLSQRKAEYVLGLAEKFVSGELSAHLLADASYEEVLEKLIAVRGLGRWSVEMFACFGLKRMDVFSLGDLGVQRGMAAFVGRDVAKLKAKGGKWKYMSEKEMEEISDRFRPYRSLFMWYMWRVEETDISTLE